MGAPCIHQRKQWCALNQHPKFHHLPCRHSRYRMEGNFYHLKVLNGSFITFLFSLMPRTQNRCLHRWPRDHVSSQLKQRPLDLRSSYSAGDNRRIGGGLGPGFSVACGLELVIVTKFLPVGAGSRRGGCLNVPFRIKRIRQ
nr:hypothetical protein Iba_chr14bCG11430 [Ipomoea batatas]